MSTFMHYYIDIYNNRIWFIDYASWACKLMLKKQFWNIKFKATTKKNPSSIKEYSYKTIIIEVNNILIAAFKWVLKNYVSANLLHIKKIMVEIMMYMWFQGYL